MPSETLRALISVAALRRVKSSDAWNAAARRDVAVDGRTGWPQRNGQARGASCIRNQGGPSRRSPHRVGYGAAEREQAHVERLGERGYLIGIAGVVGKPQEPGSGAASRCAAAAWPPPSAGIADHQVGLPCRGSVRRPPAWHRRSDDRSLSLVSTNRSASLAERHAQVGVDVGGDAAAARRGDDRGKVGMQRLALIEHLDEQQVVADLVKGADTLRHAGRRMKRPAPVWQYGQRRLQMLVIRSPARDGRERNTGAARAPRSDSGTGWRFAARSGDIRDRPASTAGDGGRETGAPPGHDRAAPADSAPVRSSSDAVQRVADVECVARTAAGAMRSALHIWVRDNEQM